MAIPGLVCPNKAQRVTSDPPVSHVEWMIAVCSIVTREAKWLLTPFERFCSYFLSTPYSPSLPLLCFSENIRSITDLVEPEDDCRTITAVHDRIDKETTERRKEHEKAHANLKGLSLYWTPRFRYGLMSAS